MSLEHTLERADVVSFLAEFEPPPMSEELREATAELADALAGAWSHGALPPGVALGGYTIQEPLGHGGQASVYRAEDAAGQSFALKVPHQELLQRLIREAQILFHLDHPRVVRIVAAEVKASPPYLVTEHLSGGTLADVLERAPEGRLEPERVREVALAVLEALAYAHEKGVIHRDLKPSNILFDAAGEPKVADFGIGSLSLVNRLEGTLVSHDRTGVAGTPLYMAPEQELAGAEVDARADLYALGKLVYRALSGRSPRTIKPLRRVLPELDVAWEDFILRLVEDDPAERYPSAVAAREALLELPGAVPSLPAPPARQALPRLSAPNEVEAEAERAPWATGVLVDQVLTVAQRLSARERGGLFAFVPHPWTPGRTLRGVHSVERALPDLDEVLALDPLGVALRGRTIRATFESWGTESRQSWLEAALADFLSGLADHSGQPPDEVFLVGRREDSLVAEAGRGSTSDWYPAAEAARHGREVEGWIVIPAAAEHRLVIYAPHETPPSKQRLIERLSGLARHLAPVLDPVLEPGEAWRHLSPGPQFDSVQRNRAAQELAQRGSLVLHVEPSGRFLVYSGRGVQATRSLAYLRRLLEGGLGLISEGSLEPFKFPATRSAGGARRYLPLLLPTCAILICLLGLLVGAPRFGPFEWVIGLLATAGSGYSAWEFTQDGPPWRKFLNFFVVLLLIGVGVSMLEVVLR